MHFFEGWVVFLIALACLFALMWLLAALTGVPGRALDILDFDRMAGRPGGRSPDIGPVPAAAVPAAMPRALMLSITTMAVAAVLLVPLAMRPQIVPERPGLFTYPLQLDAWIGEPSFLDRAIETQLGTDDYILVDYVHRNSGERVNLWVAYYDDQLGDSNIHSPTTCLPGAGWEYVTFGPHATGLDDFSGTPLIVNRGVIVKGAQRIVMYFWMEMRGRSLHESHLVKFFNLRDSLIEGRSDGALVRLYTPLGADETPADGDARLAEMLQRMYPPLQPHVGP
jgi:EpsI family protein